MKMNKNKKIAIIKTSKFLLVSNIIIAVISFLISLFNGFEDKGLIPGSSTLDHTSNNILQDFISFLPYFLIRTLFQTIIVFLILFFPLVKSNEERLNQIDELEKNKEENDNKNELQSDN
jgi:hypothetical protein